MADQQHPRYTDPNDQKLFDRFVELYQNHQSDPDVIPQTVMRYLQTEFPAPRDQDLAFEMCRDVLDQFDNVLIYGGGLHTQHLYKTLTPAQKTKIAGVIDRRPATVRGLDDVPVVTIENASSLNFDNVLIAHPVRELDMEADLKDAGFGDKNLIKIYGQEAYSAKSLAKHSSEITKDAVIREPDYVVLDTIGMTWQLLDDESLTTILPPEKTVKLYQGRPEHTPPSGPYHMIDMRQSVAVLINVLKKLQPKVVFLRTTVQLNTDIFAVLVKEILPDAHLIHEFYDGALVFSGDYMCSGWGYSDETVQLALQADVYSFCNSDTVLYKNGSDLWDPFLSYAQGEHFLYYPLMAPKLLDSTPPPAPDDGPLRIIYAGSIHPPGAFEGNSAFNWANVRPFFDKIVETPGVAFTLYNNLHRGQDNDELYADFLDRYADGPITYNRGVPFDVLMQDCPNHHYGWTAFYRPKGEELPLIDKVTTHNKLTGYILAGVPVIVTDYFTHVAGLIEDFNAGFVVTSEEIADLGARLNWDDYRRHKEGALKLRAYMLEHNVEILEHLQAKL